MNELHGFYVDQLRTYTHSRVVLLSDIWEIGQRLPKFKGIEQEAYDTSFGRYGRTVVANFTHFELARLCGHDACNAVPQVQ